MLIYEYIMASEDKELDSIESGLFKDSTGHTIQDYPGEIENGYLIGVDNGGGWYYSPSMGSIKNYQLEGGGSDRPLELKLQISMDKEEVDEAFNDISELSEDLIDKTVLGHSFVLASELSDQTHLSGPQSKVYALREVYEVGRTQTARVLDKAPNTIDNQRSNANRKAKKAKKFVELIQKYSPEE